jgi:ATP/ADP translocase
MFWSYANSIFPIKTAKWTYGLFCVMGSLGGILGGRNVGALAKAWGTREVMWLLIPLFLILLVQCRIASKTIGELHPDQKEQTDLSSGLRVLFKSQYLGYLLALIIVIQIAVTLIDYQYNRILEVTYTTTSSRTYIIGQIYAAIDMASLVLQLMTGVILRYIGVPLTLLGIPLLLGVAVGSFLAWPTFLALAIAKITSKSTGYSLFRSAKEILYIPLTYEEKTQGKAVIDILSYRFAKGLASLLLMLILFFQLIAPSEQLLPSALFAESLTTIVALANSSLVTVCTSLLLAVWIWLTLLIVRRYRLKVSLEQEREQS